MTFDLSLIALLIGGYVALLFLIAYCTNKDLIPSSIVSHPATYILSMGVFASAWSFYGAVEIAKDFGHGALAYYIGASVLFLFAPVTLAPIAELTRRFKIPSLADLLVFRYHSQNVGILVMVCSLLALIPLLSVQIQAVSDTLAIITAPSESFDQTEPTFANRDLTAFGYCLLLTIFTMMFGASRFKQRGLVVTLAVESLIKLIAFLAVGYLAIWGVFGGMSELDQWLVDNPDRFQALIDPNPDQSPHALLIIFVTATLAMPHVFQSSMVNAHIKRSMRITSWAFPLFLMLMAIPIFPVLWAGQSLDVSWPVQYYTLAVPLAAGNEWITILAFIGGLSAATGALVSIVLSCTMMVLNHGLLPFSHFGNQRDLGKQLVFLRRVVICFIFVVAYVFFLTLRSRHSILDLALIAFVQILQFFPAVIATPYWSRGNRWGLIIGVCLGSIVSIGGFMVPTLLEFNSYNLPFLGVISVGSEHWDVVAVLSLAVNIAGFITASLVTPQSPEEKYSASLCTEDELSHPVRVILDVHSCEEIRDRLVSYLGPTMAETQINRAISELGISFSERRPYSLRRLRDRLESNLSVITGRSVAKGIIDRSLPYLLPEKEGSTDINLIESRLHRYRNRLSGMAAELDNLRRYHRNTLQELPISVCSLGGDSEVLMWNKAMEALTNIDASSVVGSHIDDLPSPWNTIISDFCASSNMHLHGQALSFDNNDHFFNLHKAQLSSPHIYDGIEGQVILLEDVTELKKLEHKLAHSERLASVGRLAAGVAHEIGNPVTGIACLAQNLKYEDTSEEALDTAQQILSQTDRINRIVQSLVSFSRSGDISGTQFVHIELRQCVEEAIQLLSLQKDKTQVDYQNHVKDDIMVWGDSQKLIQVFVNLLSNARDASEESGAVSIEASNLNRHTEIWVTDEGQGISQEHLEQIMEPFFTTKDPGEGTGLGLAMVYSIIEDHQGAIDIESPVDPDTLTGARFIIKLPHSVEPKPTDDQTNTVTLN
ncbi:sensor histidine kinase [Sessilibacter corallicola]|uniref:sensor histidine kinase n=1 Tax=Sessilibacter corallicola TaxID=2904075 RepID=UPI001E54B91B|nr:ATP-binding protein [Sessilibacter corallicola]